MFPEGPRQPKDSCARYSIDMNMSPEIRLLPRTGKFDPDYLETLGSATIYACDCAVNGAESWTEIQAGYSRGRILNIDHHASSPRWYRQISSTNLAMSHVLEHGPAREADIVVIDHTDCDSVLCAGLVSGRLASDDRFGAAAIAADHTGAADPISDLLQAIEYRRDRELSFRSLGTLLANGTLEPEVKTDLEKRLWERAQARASVDRGDVRLDDEGFAWGRNDSDIDAALYPGVLPRATLILLIRPFPNAPGRWECKVRLGPAAPEGLTLFEVQDDDPELSFGGRWNAGSNKYGHGGAPGGTGVAPERYAAALKSRLSRWLEAKTADTHTQ